MSDDTLGVNVNDSVETKETIGGSKNSSEELKKLLSQGVSTVISLRSLDVAEATTRFVFDIAKKTGKVGLIIVNPE